MALLRNKLTQFAPYWFRIRPKSGYIVLIPENSIDTPEDNVLLRTEDEFPNFAELSPRKCATGMGKLVLDYEAGVWSVEDHARDPQSTNTFGAIIEELDKLDTAFSTAWITVKTMNIIKSNKLPSSVYQKIHARAMQSHALKFQSIPIFNACREIAKDKNLNAFQRRVVNKFLLESRLNGVELPSEKLRGFNGILTDLANYKASFQNNVMTSARLFTHEIQDSEVVENFPDHLLKHMALDGSRHQEGPWMVTLHPYIYPEFLQFCSSRTLRWNAWNANIIQASSYLSKEVCNSRNVEILRSLRKNMANMLGYENFVQMSMETKMARTYDNVMSMISTLLVKAKKKQTNEIASLQKFAEANGIQDSLHAYDIPYWRREQSSELFRSLNSLKLEEYFPFEHVWCELLSFCSELFGISFEESKKEIPTWHPDVRVYNVLDQDGKYRSSFYLDPYKRPGEKLDLYPGCAWVVNLRNRSDASKRTPLVSLIYNFEQHTGPHSVTLLSLKEVVSLFKRFGDALQQMLAVVPYGEVAGRTNIEWDAVDVCSSFMSCWLSEPTILTRLSHHYESGESFSQNQVDDIIRSQKHMAAYDLCSELYFSHLDLKLHTSDDDWLDVVKDIWDMYRPFPLDKRDSHVCSMTAIMSDIWAAAYFSHTWSQMVAADVFQAFKKVDGCEGSLGHSFRSTFLELGGGCHAGETFRLFRGRDPSPEALLSQNLIS